tara:strand:- start:2160 stop:2498 length:339 start_codon:yes stop_codon:yes gene_type:complete
MNQNKLGSIDERLLHYIRFLVEEELEDAQTILSVLETPWSWQPEADALWEKELKRRIYEDEAAVVGCEEQLDSEALSHPFLRATAKKALDFHTKRIADTKYALVVHQRGASC